MFCEGNNILPGKIDNTVSIKMFSLYFSAICFWRCFMFLSILVNAYVGNNINTVIFWRFSFHLGRSKHLKCLMFIIKVIFEVLFDLWLDITLINEITIISLENVVAEEGFNSMVDMCSLELHISTSYIFGKSMSICFLSYCQKSRHNLITV